MFNEVAAPDASQSTSNSTEVPIIQHSESEAERSDGEEEVHQDEVEPPQPDERPRREIREPVRYGEWVAVATETASPETYDEAMKSTDHTKWEEAMMKEMESLKSNDVWDLVPRPEGKVIGCKWVYKVKVGADGNIERH